MSNLFYVNKLVSEVISEHVDADGVITDEGIKKLEGLEVQKDEIIDNMIKSHKNQQIMIDGIASELVRLKLRQDTYRQTQISILKTVRPYLTEGEKIETAEYILKWTTSSPLEGLDGYDAELSFANKDDSLSQYVVRKITPDSYSFDKVEIKKALKDREGRARELPIGVYINTTKNPKIT